MLWDLEDCETSRAEGLGGGCCVLQSRASQLPGHLLFTPQQCLLTATSHGQWLIKSVYVSGWAQEQDGKAPDGCQEHEPGLIKIKASFTSFQGLLSYKHLDYTRHLQEWHWVLALLAPNDRLRTGLISVQ